MTKASQYIRGLFLIPGALMAVGSFLVLSAAIVFADPGAYSASGTVSFGGTQVAGLSVGLSSSNGGGNAQTDSQGNYTVANLQNGDYSASLQGTLICDQLPSCQESISLGLRANKTTSTPTTNVITVNGADAVQDFSLPSTVAVDVNVNKYDGSPANDVSLSAFAQSGSVTDATDANVTYDLPYKNATMVYASNKTDSAGYYRLYLIPGLKYMICGASSDANPLENCSEVQVDTATSTTITLPAPDIRYSVTGKVKIGSTLAAGTSVSLSSSDGSGGGQTDANGDYSIASLKAGLYTATLLNSSAQCDHPSDLCNQSTDMQLTVKDNTKSPAEKPISITNGDVVQDFNLPSPVSVAVNVHTFDGAPAANASVLALAKSGTMVDAQNSSIVYTLPYANALMVYANGNTGTDGSKVMYLFPGFTYAICASKQDVNPGLDSCVSVMVSGSSSVDVTFPSQITTHSFSGTATVGGKPITNASLSLASQSGSNGGPTDSNGHFSVAGLNDDSYSLGIQSSNLVCDHDVNNCNQSADTSLKVQDNSASTPSKPVVVSGSDVSRNLAIPATASVAIHVRNADGGPASGVSLTAFAQSGEATDVNNANVKYKLQFQNSISVYANTGTSEAGDYVLYLIPGFTYRFCGSSSGTNPVDSCADPVSVTSDTSLTITMPLPTPLNLTATSPASIPSLSWNGPNLVTGSHYSVFRDGQEIASVSSSSYVDNTASPGVHAYFVEVNSNDFFGLPSNTIQVNVTATPTYSVSAFTSASRNSSSNSNLVANITTTSSSTDTLYVSVLTGTFSGTVGCSDTKGNSYTVIADKNTGNGRLFVCSARTTNPVTSGDTITATYPGFSGISIESVNRISGLTAPGQPDSTSVTATGSNTGVSVGPITPTGALAVVIGVVSNTNTATFTPATGYTVVGQVSTGTGSAKKTITPVYRIVTTASGYSLTGTLSGSGFWQAALTDYR